MIQVGKIVNTFGLKGELKILINPLYLDLKLRKNSVAVVKNAEYKISKVRTNGNLWFVSFEDRADINLVEFLKGELFYLDDIYFVKPEKGYYRYQLSDFEVIDQDGNIIGLIKEVETTGYQDLMRIKTSSKDVLIPMVDAFVKNIDFSSKKVTVQVIEGLV